MRLTTATGSNGKSSQVECRFYITRRLETDKLYRWESHWRWIVMLIVLLVAAIVGGVGGTILFKRHKRRKNLGSTSGSTGNWGPNSSAHDFDTQGRVALAAAGPVTEEKKTRSERKGGRLAKLRGR